MSLSDAMPECGLTGRIPTLNGAKADSSRPKSGNDGPDAGTGASGGTSALERTDASRRRIVSG
jgi:hypothetical protein